MPTLSGEEVLAMRQRKGWTQVQLAEAVGVSERTVIRWEQEGVPEVPARLLAKIAEEDD